VLNKPPTLLPILLLLGFTLIFLYKLVSLQPIAIGNVEDHLRILFPYHTYDAQWLKSLTVPLWNPYSLSGFPYLASMRCHIFYPTSLLFLILPVHLGMNLSMIIHVFLAGSLMFFLARVLGLGRFSSLVSALAFMFSGYLLNDLWWGHEERLTGLMWTPAIFAFFLKATDGFKLRFAVLSGVAFAMALFSGHLQVPYYSLFALFLFTLFTIARHLLQSEPRAALNSSLCFLVVTAVGIGIAAIQILPAIELTRHSIRAPSQESFSFFTRWSMHYSYILTFLFPRLSVIGRQSFAFPPALGYIGILPLCMVCLSFTYRKSRHIYFWMLLLVVSLTLAVGRYTPLYAYLYRYFPGFSAFRNPIFWIFLYVFSSSVLSGFGAQAMCHYIQSHAEPNQRRITGLLKGIIAAIAFACLCCACLLFSNMIPRLYALLHTAAPSSVRTLEPDLARDLFAVGISFLGVFLLLAFHHKCRKGTVIFQSGVICLIFLDLVAYGWSLIHTYSWQPFVAKHKYVDFLNRRSGPFRVLPLLDYPEQDAPLKLYKIASINGYGSFEILQDYVDFLAAFQKQPVTQEATIVRVADVNSKAVDMLNTKYILTDKMISDANFKLVFEDMIPAAKTWDPYNKHLTPLKVYENLRALPRAFIVHSFKLFSDRKQILSSLSDPKIDMTKVVFLEEVPEAASTAPAPKESGNESVSFSKYEDNELILKTSLDHSGYLVLSEIYYPGWSAYVDGNGVQIHRANYIFRSIALGSGEHTVRFVYRPLSFRIGATISIVTVIVLLVFLAGRPFKPVQQSQQ
jgi:hypothetical protein